MRGSLTAKLRSKDVCPECGGSSLIQDPEAGELVCRGCGYVVSSTLLNLGPEWRAFEPEQRENSPRVGAPVTWTIHDKGLSTIMGWQSRDASGRRLGSEAQARLYRLRRLHQRSKVSESAQRSTARALSEVSRVCGALSLPRNVAETSSVIYRRAVQGRLIRGRTIQSIAVASIYVACRQCGVLRSIGDVAEAGGLSKGEVARTYRFLLRELSPAVPQEDPNSYVGKIVSKLALTGETERLAMLILSRVSEMKLTGGRGPSGIAAACVYIGCHLSGERRTQSQIAREAQVTEVTIRNRYRELVQRLEFNVRL